ncbi:MAG: hypothetical protein H6702_12245 [Myxococcales bacterium]|nr:hypothetical protein [Myxococcales bacterium]
MLVIGIILIVAAVGLGVAHVMARRKTGYLLAASDQTAGALADIARRVAGEIGGGGFQEFVTLTGHARCDQPLMSPLGERPCLYYRATVTRQYEEEYEERDSQGNVRRRTRRGSETMSSQSEHVDFLLVDDPGDIDVRLHGADFDGLVKTVDRFDPQGGFGGGTLSYGRFSMQVGGMGRGRRTLGFQYTEHILPAAVDLTVVGQATDRGGRMQIGAGGPAWIVSTKSKAEMIGAAKQTASLTAALSGVCALAGVGLTIAGALQG